MTSDRSRVSAGAMLRRFTGRVIRARSCISPRCCDGAAVLRTPAGLSRMSSLRPLAFSLSERARGGKAVLQGLVVRKPWSRGAALHGRKMSTARYGRGAG